MEVSGPFPPGWHVTHVAETGSTNADLLAAAAAGAPDRTVRYTDHQTAGRGRLDRTWDAPPGSNLLVSFLFTSGDPVVLMRRIAIAAVDAVAEVAGLAAELKWPNDVLVDGRKLAGLLAQRTREATVIGLGLNVGWAPDGAARMGGTIVPADVLAALLRAFDGFAAATPTASLADAVHDRYTGLLATLGRHVRVELPAGELTGRVTGVEPDGRLLVLDECAVTHRLDIGDVVHLRPV